MMGRQEGGQGEFFYAFDLDRIVPPDHLVRQIDGVLDLGWVHKELASYYSHTGRPSIDPVLMIRMLIVGYVFAIRSERRLCAEVQVNLAYRWFCKLSIEDKIPDHSVFCRARRERFRESDALRRVFDRVVAMCIYAAVVALPNPVARDYLLLLLFTGLRRNEAAGLRWADVDFAGGVIRVPAARTKSGRKLDVPTSDFVHDLLAARHAIGQEEYVFPSNSATGHITEPKFPLTQVALACGIRVSVHDLRRTFITVAESTDISVSALKALVNHSLGGDVTSGYIILTTERLREPAQRVADRLKELCGVAKPVAG